MDSLSLAVFVDEFFMVTSSWHLFDCCLCESQSFLYKNLYSSVSLLILYFLFLAYTAEFQCMQMQSGTLSRRNLDKLVFSTWAIFLF